MHMNPDQAAGGSIYDKQITEFRSKYGPKRQLVRAMWALAFEDQLAEMWDSAADAARRSLLQKVYDATAALAQQAMASAADKHKMKVIIDTCLTDVVNTANDIAGRSFKQPGGLLQLCHMILHGQENDATNYPERQIEMFLQQLDFDVFNELNKDPEQHRVMMREFRSMYCVEWLIALVESFQ